MTCFIYNTSTHTLPTSSSSTSLHPEPCPGTSSLVTSSWKPCLGTSCWEPLLGNLFLVTLPGNLAWEPYWEPLPGNLAWEPVPGNLFLGTPLGNLFLGTGTFTMAEDPTLTLGGKTCSWKSCLGNLLGTLLGHLFLQTSSWKRLLENMFWEPCFAWEKHVPGNLAWETVPGNLENGS